MRRWLRPAAAAGALGAGIAVALVLAQSTTRAAGLHNTPRSAAATGTFTEFAVPTASSVPQSIAAGPDGNLWFTESQAGGRFERPGEERPQQSTPISTIVSEARSAGCDRHINTRENGSRRET